MKKTAQELMDESIKEVDENPQVETHEDGTRTVTLTEPVMYAKTQLNTLTFRKPKGRDWRETDRADGEAGKAFSMAASLCDKPMKLFDDMEGDDALLCVAVAGVMGKSLSTGGTL